MLESEKLAIAAHLHVAMRRKIGRVTDVEWMLRSPEYAREIIRVAQAEPQHEDLLEWAGRLHEALFGGGGAVGRDAGHAAGAPADFQDSRQLPARAGAAGKPGASRYVGSLR